MQPSSRFIRWSGIVAMLGGVLWLPYGVLELLEPWGTATAPYREDVGYEVVTDGARFIAYSLPGSLALLLTALGLLGTRVLLGLPSGRLGKIGRILTYVTMVLAVLSLGGVIALFDPVFTAGRIVGTLTLGIATFLAGVAARRAGRPPGWGVALVVLGLVGVFLFPLWPLVYAVGWLSEGAGAAIIALFGVAWIVFGWALRSGRAVAPAPGSGYLGGGQSD